MAWKYSKKRQRSDGLKQIDGKKKKAKKYDYMQELVKKYGWRG